MLVTQPITRKRIMKNEKCGILQSIHKFFGHLLNLEFSFSERHDELGKPQKITGFLVARPLRGGGVRAWPLRKNTVRPATK